MRAKADVKSAYHACPALPLPGGGSLPIRASSGEDGSALFNFDQVAPSLFQGSAPPCGAPLRRGGFRALVLAAMEHQPASTCFPGVAVHHAPMDDARPTRTEIERALQAAEFVAARLRRGEPTLVTCAQGLNRSGLISALALVRLGESAELAVAQVRLCRQGALFNKHFVEVVRRVANTSWRPRKVAKT